MRAFVLAAAVLAAPARALEVSVELRRGPDAPGPARDWFAAFERLSDSVSASLARLADDAYRPSEATAKAALDLAGSAARDHEAMTGDDSGIEAVEALRGAPASALYSAEEGGLLRWLELLRQGALEAEGPRGVLPANALVSVRSGARSVEVAALDVARRRGRELEALARCVRGLDAGAELAPAVLGSSRLWLRLAGADFFADLRAPAEGGLVRVRYRERGSSAAGQASFYFFTKVLYDLGFSARVEGGRLYAVFGPGRGEASVEDVEEALASAFRARAASARMEGPLAAYLADSGSRKENVARLDYLARVFLAEGALPFSDLRAGVADHRAREPEREAERARMDKVLATFGLGSFPAEAGVGPRTVALHYDRVLAAAAARGEVVLSGGRVSRGPKAAKAPKAARAAGTGEAFIARLTYDRARAMLGNRVYATPFAVPADAAALKRSRALLTTSGGPFSRALAAGAGVPAFELPGARWTASGIAYAGGVLREGEALRFAPASGEVSALPAASQELLVRLDDALLAYDRGGDINALALWTAGQARALAAPARRELAAALLGALEKRRASGVPQAHLDRIRETLGP